MQNDRSQYWLMNSDGVVRLVPNPPLYFRVALPSDLGSLVTDWLTVHVDTWRTCHMLMSHMWHNDVLGNKNWLGVVAQCIGVWTLRPRIRVQSPELAQVLFLLLLFCCYFHVRQALLKSPSIRRELNDLQKRHLKQNTFSLHFSLESIADYTVDLGLDLCAK